MIDKQNAKFWDCYPKLQQRQYSLFLEVRSRNTSANSNVYCSALALSSANVQIENWRAMEQGEKSSKTESQVLSDAEPRVSWNAKNLDAPLVEVFS